MDKIWQCTESPDHPAMAAQSMADKGEESAQALEEPLVSSKNPCISVRIEGEMGGRMACNIFEKTEKMTTKAHTQSIPEAAEVTAWEKPLLLIWQIEDTGVFFRESPLLSNHR